MADEKKLKMYALVERYKSSNQTRADFCKSVGVTTDTLSYWFTKYTKERSATSKKNNFKELEVDYPSGNQVQRGQISFPNGVVVDLEGVSESLLLRLIKFQ
jgi:transposase-like protein